MDIEPRNFSKLEKSKSSLIFSNQFFALQLLKLSFREIKNMPFAAGTDGREFIYNPDILYKYSIEEIKGICVHEIYHNMFFHSLRRGNRDQMLANMAMDLAINPLIIEQGFSLPKDSLNEERFKGMNFEAIYEIIKDENKYKNMAGLGDGEGSWNIGNVSDMRGENGETFSESEKRVVEEEIKIQIKQSLLVAKKRGTLPAGLELMIDEILEPKINWREHIQQFYTEISRNDYNWNRPNKRYIGGGIYLPTLYKPEIGKIIIAFDTSGSIDKEALTEMASEQVGMASLYNISSMVILYCDTQVHREEVDCDSLEFHPKGGGGTDYKPVFDFIEKEEEQPVALIYFTDGYCDSFPNEESDYKVLWVLTEKNKNFFPPWGSVLNLK